MNPDPVHAQLLIFDRPPMLSIFLCAASDGIAAHQHRSISGSRHMHFSALRQTHDRRLGDRQNGARLGERKMLPRFLAYLAKQNRFALGKANNGPFVCLHRYLCVPTICHS